MGRVRLPQALLVSFFFVSGEEYLEFIPDWILTSSWVFCFVEYVALFGPKVHMGTLYLVLWRNTWQACRMSRIIRARTRLLAFGYRNRLFASIGYAVPIFKTTVVAKKMNGSWLAIRSAQITCGNALTSLMNGRRVILMISNATFGFWRRVRRGSGCRMWWNARGKTKCFLIFLSGEDNLNTTVARYFSFSMRVGVSIIS